MVKDVIKLRIFRDRRQSFPADSVVKHLPANAGDMGSILDQGRSPCGGAPKPVHHYYGTCALEPGAVTTDSRPPQSLFSTTMELRNCEALLSSPGAATMEPVAAMEAYVLETVLHTKTSHSTEKPSYCIKECACHNQRKPTQSNEDPAYPKINK